MKKRLKYLLMLAGIALLLSPAALAWHYLADPFRRVQTCDHPREAQAYLRFYQGWMSYRNFDYLLTELLAQNESLSSLETVCLFIEEQQKCAYLPYMEARCAFYQSLPADTVLEFTVSRFYMHREILTFSHVQESRVFEVVERMRERCGE